MAIERKSSANIFAGMMVFLTLSAAYLFTFPQPNVFYAIIVFFHATVGVIATVWILLWLWRLLRDGSMIARLGWALMFAGAILGVVLIKLGTSRVEWNWLYVHIALCVAGVAFLVADRLSHPGTGIAPAFARAVLCL